MIPAFGIDPILARDFFGTGMEWPLSAAIDTLAAVNISRHLVERWEARLDLRASQTTKQFSGSRARWREANTTVDL